MKVVCDRGALLEALNLVGGVVVSRTPKPVLTCVKITAADNTLSLAATDLEMSIRVSTPRVEINAEGQALLPAEKLSAIVRESIDSTLTIEVEEDQAHIRSQDSHFKVFGQKVDDFPPIPEFEGEADFEVEAGDLHHLIAQTIFATARESSRYAINGVLIERDGKKLSVVATDGRRLAMSKGDCRKAKGQSMSAIVPTKALNTLLRLFHDQEQAVRIKVANNQIFFAAEGTVMVSNLVEGNFPPYQDVIPKDADKKAQLKTDTLASAVRRVALLTNEESKSVRMAFREKGLTLSSRAPEMGEAEVTCDIDSYTGDEIEIGFNPQFVLDMLKVVSQDQVQVELKAPNKPGILRAGANFLYVIMPVNLS